MGKEGLDRLTKDLAHQFGLGATSGPLVDSFLGFLSFQRQDGIDGLLEDIRYDGYSAEVDSWLGLASNRPISAEYLTDVLGEDAINYLASKNGLNAETTASALAVALPRIIDMLSESGSIPASMPAWASGSLSVSGRSAKRLSESIAEERRKPTQPAPSDYKPTINPLNPERSTPEPRVVPTRAVVQERPAKAKPKQSGPAVQKRWAPIVLAPAYLLGIVALIAGYSLYRNRQTTVPAETIKPKPVASTAAAVVKEPQTSQASLLEPATLNLTRSGGLIRYSGIVKEYRIKDNLLTALGGNEADGTIDVDLGVGDADWIAYLSEIVKNDFPAGAEITFSGNEVIIGGTLGESRLVRLKESIQEIMGSEFKVTTLDPAQIGLEANAIAKERIESLLAKDIVSTTDLCNALNKMVVNFGSGSVQIPEANQELLKVAVPLFAKLPTAAKIEIVGHTDSSGSKASNERLSERRSLEVMRFLITEGVSEERIVSIGMGSENPLTSNDTQMGRFQNRRIEFRVFDPTAKDSEPTTPTEQ